MFTGIIEGAGTVVERRPGAEMTRLVIDAGFLAEGVAVGDSVANNGCCLTVAGREGERLAFDLLRETEQRTNLKALRPGARVNLERSLRADGRLGGHFITGHVDGVGRILKLERNGQDYELVTGFEKGNGRYLAPKGCIAVDGMSLTVAAVGDDFFSAWIIPHTLSVTTLGERKPGDELNLEFDLLAKYTEKILATQASGR